MVKPTMWFPTRSDTNRAVQAQKMVGVGNFGFRKQRNCTIHVAKTKALSAVTAKLICDFVFAYADCWFSHSAAHMISLYSSGYRRVIKIMTTCVLTLL